MTVPISQPGSHSVTEVLQILRLAIAEYLPRVSVYGEVSGLTKARSGHYYFALKDPASPAGNQIDCVMWKSSVSRLGFDLTEGLSVVGIGEPAIYEVSGRLQLVLSRLTPLGDGLLQERFRRLKELLEKEGLFDSARKKTLPRVPRGIGVVTSKSGAAIHDLAVRLADRMPHVPVYVVDARVQGEGSIQELVQGIKQLDEFDAVDIIVVTRGGGSLQDLWSFNEEAVVRAVAACQKPVVSAVGHEVDVTLCDLAADLRAPTPTAAAELIVPDRADVLQLLEQFEARLQTVPRLVRQFEQRLDDLEMGLMHRVGAVVRQSALCLETVEAQIARIHPQRIILAAQERITTLLKELRVSVTSRLHSNRESLGFFSRVLTPARLQAQLAPRFDRVTQLEQRLDRSLSVVVREKSQVLDKVERELALASPHKILERGFCLLQQNGKVTSGVADLSVPSSVEILFADGVANAEIIAIKRNES
jgi:exodeoxyribonuclease VII large subunit